MFNIFQKCKSQNFTALISPDVLLSQNFILAYHNVPKTAGTSINNAMNELLSDRSINIGKHSGLSRLFTGKKQIVDMNEAELNKIKFVQSHSLSIQDLRLFPRRPIILMTVMRDPVEREISGYFHAISEQNKKGIKPFTNITEYSEKIPKNLFSNSILKSFPELQDPFAKTEFEKVISVLRHFQFIFVMEDIAKFAEVPKLLFDADIKIPHVRSGAKNTDEKIDREKIKENNQLDCEVYHWITHSRPQNSTDGYMKVYRPRKLSFSKTQQARIVFYRKLSGVIISSLNTPAIALKLLRQDNIEIDRGLLSKFLIDDWKRFEENLNKAQVKMLTKNLLNAWHNQVVDSVPDD